LAWQIERTANEPVADHVRRLVDPRSMIVKSTS
jgi:hypothetical protein